MYEVNFYQDVNGNQPVKEYLDMLEKKVYKKQRCQNKI